MVGPLLFGLLHQLTGGWTWPLAFLIGAALAATLAGAVLSCPLSAPLPAQCPARPAEFDGDSGEKTGETGLNAGREQNLRRIGSGAGGRARGRAKGARARVPQATRSARWMSAAAPISGPSPERADATTRTRVAKENTVRSATAART